MIHGIFEEEIYVECKTEDESRTIEMDSRSRIEYLSYEMVLA